LKSHLLKIATARRRFAQFVARRRSPALWFLLRRSTRPLSRYDGSDRGISPGRFYIDAFIEQNRHLLVGACLEIQRPLYLTRFDSAAITSKTILDIDEKNGAATPIGDLQDLHGVDENSYDCLVVTQTLMYMQNLEAAVAELFRILRPGGHALVTVAAMERQDPALGLKDQVRLLPGGMQALFGRQFGDDEIRVATYGNILTGIGHWTRMSVHDLPNRAFRSHDPNFPVIVGVVARKRPPDH